jgi:hypothetical protein
MKPSSLTCFTSMTFLAALAIPVQLAAQGRKEAESKLPRYKLVDIATFGGPVSFIHPLSGGSLSMANCQIRLNAVVLEVLILLLGCATSSSCSFIPRRATYSRCSVSCISHFWSAVLTPRVHGRSHEDLRTGTPAKYGSGSGNNTGTLQGRKWLK